MAHDWSDPVGPYAMVAEFETADDLVSAAESARNAGYTNMDAYSPFPIHGLSEAIGFKDQKVPWTVFFGGVMGGIGGYTMQWYLMAVDYPMNVGGKPLNSLPSYIPITFECTVLLAALGAFIGMLAFNRLPKPYHPIFNTPDFERASQDRFFLAIEVKDKNYDNKETRSFLDRLNPVAVSEVAL